MDVRGGTRQSVLPLTPFIQMAQKKRPLSHPAKGTSSNPYKLIARIPRQIESASTLWLDFFQQALDITVNDSVGPNGDKAAVGRARLLADYALETFQDRFPGVHP